MNFTLSYAKKILILGIVLLVLGSSTVAILLLFTQPETITKGTVDLTTTGSYFSDKFRSEAGYWLDLNIKSAGSSTIHVSGQTVGEVFKVDGTVYDYTVPISTSDVYQIQVENKAGHSEWFGFTWVPDSNTFSGNFSLEKKPDYFFKLLPLGGIMLALGLLTIPTMSYMEYRARQRAKMLYDCPRCKREVQIGLQTCPYCKLDLTKYWITCKYCNKFYDSHLEKCPKCGAETQI
jgi:hypothetical protein